MSDDSIDADVHDLMNDRSFGFSVDLVNVPTRTVRGEEVIAVNANHLRGAVLGALALKCGTLTGAEVFFIRHYREETQHEFAEILGVSHVAIHKWEVKGDLPTRMAKGTEFLIRCLISEQSQVDSILSRPPMETTKKLGNLTISHWKPLFSSEEVEAIKNVVVDIASILEAMESEDESITINFPLEEGWKSGK